MVGYYRQAAVYLAEMDLSPRGPELGMGDCPSDVDHQPGSAPAAHHADEIDAEDAARGPADQVDSGEVQEIQLARSAQGCDERRDQRALQERRRESGGRMFADADPDAVSVCLLQNAGDSAGSAARPLAMDQRSVGGRSDFHIADPDGDQQPGHTENDTAGRHGS